MDANLQLRIQRYGWDKAADCYEDGWRDSLALAQRKLLERAGPQPAERVLDIACGTGLVTFPLAEAVGPDGNVIASDLSQRMVDILAGEASARGYCWVESVRAGADAHRMVPDGSIDLVTCALGLMYFPDTRAVMQEVLRVLRPGGRAVFAVWGDRRNCGWADIFPIVDARVKSEVCPLFFRLGTSGALAREMGWAGFELESEDCLSTHLPYDSAERALEAAFAGGPVALAYNRFDEQMREEAHAEYLASIAPFLGDDGYRIPGEFVVCSGRKS
ncbi:methyltransferase domain-containing protein [Altererythrobacter salegens]|uniref:Methyltransferase domain-containing protein n=1 Tax=Croceibacterium salegens TaxID=1737568 RepID=A0A6I4STD1_9SPHN|nr:methyltransferase domain-containing protein [Croceibacterium salegens]MXO58267.1 methyltransferase domain-containing protein [Croceibacterium salegens]